MDFSPSCCPDGSCPPTASLDQLSLAADSSSSPGVAAPQPPSSDSEAARAASNPSAQGDPLLDSSSFVAPSFECAEGWKVLIEFCDRCRWLHRATWTQTELFLTFPPPHLVSIGLIPLNTSETGGRFRVWLYSGERRELAWDRKIEGGFPELKILKQRVRDIISPASSLGHSDKKGKDGGHVNLVV